MAQLVTKNFRKEALTIELIVGRDFSIGRSKKCDVVLGEGDGISRNHAVVSFLDGGWQVSLLSQKGELIVNEKSVESCVLKNKDIIFIAPYKIEFIDVEDVEYQLDEDLNLGGFAKKVDADTNVFLDTSKSKETNGEAFSEENTATGFEQTQRSNLRLDSFLVFRTESDKILEIKLEGSRWVVGRANKSDIRVDDPVFSREQFELRKVNNTYSLLDISPSNPTKLNGKVIGKDNFKEIFSGDIISVKTTTVELQLRSPALKDVMESAGPLVPQGLIKKVSNQPAVIMEENTNSRKKIIRVLIVLVALVALYFGVSRKDSKTPIVKVSPNESKLSSIQQKVLTDVYNAAFDFYTSGRFELCLSELKKIHNTIDSFKRSREFEKYCQSGIKARKLEDDRANKEEQERLVRQEVDATLKGCKKKMNRLTLAEAKQCLVKVAQLDPENAEAQFIYETVRQNDLVKVELATQRKRYATGVRKRQELYNKAKKFQKEKKLKKAIKAFKKVIKSSLPDPKALKKQAEKELSVIEKELYDEISKAFELCNKFYNQKKYKEAIIACEKIIETEPSFEKAHDVRRESLRTLRSKMRKLYEDAILEESLGNLDAAKEKWQKIISEDHPEDDFYEKAKIKLNKYGVEF